MLLDEKKLVADYEELMKQYEESDEWDEPAALFIRWDDSDPKIKGCIMVIPTPHPGDFLKMLLEGGPTMAQEVLRGIGEVPADMPIAAIAMVNEGWGIDVEATPSEIIELIQQDKLKISDLPTRIETRLILLVTRSKNVYFGNQDRGGHFKWIARSDEESTIEAVGNMPALLYPLVTGEPYVP